MNFQRGQDPKEAIGIGKEAILREIGGIIIEERDWNDEYWSPTQMKEKHNVVILHRNDGRYEVINNNIALSENTDEEKWPTSVEERDLFVLLNKLLEAFRKYGIIPPWFPKMQKVAARTIGIDLVPVQPMSAPIGNIVYLDHKYGSITP